MLLSAFAGTLVVGLLAAALGLGGPFHLRWLSLLSLLLVLLVVVAAGRGMRRFTRPVGELTEAARRIEAGDYSARVAERGPPDLRSVARAFNAMSARLQSSEEQRRSFLADVTHELRTQLSTIRGQAEAIADGVYPADPAHLAPILSATSALEMLVEDLRTLALSDTGSLPLMREPVDAGVLIDDAVASFRAQAEAAQVSLEAQVTEGIPALEVDPARIRGVLANLLTNALRHTPTGGRVVVRAQVVGKGVEVAVIDSGQGVPPELRDHVFERFVRGAGSPGSGLGLAIARAVVEAHGGSITLESEPGQGTTVRMSLPTADGEQRPTPPGGAGWLPG